MAQLEGSETSVASSSPTPNWWEIHAPPLSSWHSINRWQLHSHHSTSSSCDEDNSTSADLSGGPSDNNLWTHVLLNVGGGADMSQHHNHHDDGDSFLEVLSSSTKNLPTEIFDPACDYLKKMDSSWEINNPPSFNSFNGSLMEHERLTNLSDLVKNWSIAPPAANSQFDSLPCNVGLNPMTLPYVNSHMKAELLPSINEGNSSNYMPYMHDVKMENQHHQHILGSSEPSSVVISQFINGSSGMGYQVSVNDNNNNNNLEIKFNNAIRSGSDVSWSGSSRSLSDFISFKPVQFRTCKQVAVKGSDHSSSHDTKKQGYDTSSSTKGSGRSTGTTNEGKKKRSDQDNSEALLKKSKLDNSTASSSAKLQVPKVKFADRISALQQIVSPFGKTDTASVLMEAINYIRFLQEQVQLLSDPYMKLNASKEHNSWGGMERKEKDKVDLRNRGLCLVPISCTPQAFRENTAPDYWTPTYRGCLFR